MEGKALKPTTERVLRSGIVDKHMAALMERWGMLPEGAASLASVGEEKIKTATKDQLEKMAEEIGDSITNELLLRETRLDLTNVRWPVSDILIERPRGGGLVGATKSAMIDIMGRYLFRIQDVDPAWFVPGWILHHDGVSLQDGRSVIRLYKEILESQVLYVGETPVAVQVSVRPVA